MTPEDVPAADRAAWAGLSALIPEEFRSEAGEEEQRARGVRRIGGLLETDPGGCWVAEADGAVVGCAVSMVREGLWGLSLFGLEPGHQGQGLGARLLTAALGHAEGARGALIAATTDPRALRRYHRAGFRALPCLAASGQVNASRIPDGLRSRPGDLEGDGALLDRVSRHVRGAAHARGDLEVALANGYRLLVCDDRGWALERDGSPGLVAALDDDAATDLLWSCLAAARPGQFVHVDFVGTGNDWALAAALDAGLSITTEGPMFARGEVGPLRPYLPSGAYL